MGSLMTDLAKLKPYFDALTGVSNLTENQAKTLVYYAVMTWSDKPRIKPIIDVNGESGTGKSDILEQIKPWCRAGKTINARNMTEAEFRDQLADTKTALVDEADKTKAPKECENWLQQRYEPTGKEVSYRAQRPDAKGRTNNIHETHNHFGYTVIHTQNPFATSEMDRRTLRLVVYKDSSRSYKITEGLDDTPFVILAAVTDWTKPIEGMRGNAAWDVWLPLMRVAEHLRDSGFLDYACAQIKLKAEEDELTKMFEPKGLVLAEVAELYNQRIKDHQPRITATEVRKAINDRGCLYNERQIVKLAKQLGFTLVYPANRANIKVICPEELDQIMKRAGIDKPGDDELTAS